ncbi:uncharacterized protein PG998_009735 [Apiospora kogelbergensis]|uniref:uncharacterized protein n=1 Tax=Apiospora kogelbergensis TaxID=1337665 RepID=UPI00312EA810
MAAAMANLVMASLVTDLSLVTDHPREADTTAANHSTAADINRVGPKKSGGGGMGMAGGAALGLGAGVIGGALVADAWNDHEQEAYAEGYNDGNDGDDFGGGDDF